MNSNNLRGTLAVDRQVPVGFQKMHCLVDLQAASGTDPKMIERLSSGVAVETSFRSKESSA